MKTSAIFKPLTPSEQGDAVILAAGRAKQLAHAHATPAGRVADMPGMPLQNKALERDAADRSVGKFLALLRLTDPEFQKFIIDKSRASDISRRDWQRYFVERTVAEKYWYDYDMKIKQWLEKRIHEIFLHTHRERVIVKKKNLYAQTLAAYFRALSLYELHVSQATGEAKAAESVGTTSHLKVGNFESEASERLNFTAHKQSSLENKIDHTLGRSQYLAALTGSRGARDEAGGLATAAPEGGSVVKEPKPRFTKRV